jgi:hypothetical protein
MSKPFSFRDMMVVDQTDGAWDDAIGLIAYQYKKRRRGILGEAVEDKPKKMSHNQEVHYNTLKLHFDWKFDHQSSDGTIYMWRPDSKGTAYAKIPVLGSWERMNSAEIKKYFGEAVETQDCEDCECEPCVCDESLEAQFDALTPTAEAALTGAQRSDMDRVNASAMSGSLYKNLVKKI